MNKHKVIYEWAYQAPDGEVGDRIELREYDNGTFTIACFQYENDDGKRDSLCWFNEIDQKYLESLKKVLEERFSSQGSKSNNKEDV